MRGVDELVARAGRLHGDRLTLLCSFQKESSLLLDSVVRMAPRTRVVTIDTGVLFPETLQTWRAFEEHYGVAIEVEDASGDWTADRCCSDAKVAALERALDGAEAWMSGLRREQAQTRARSVEIERDGPRGLWKYNPLAHWTEDEVWREINERGLPYHPLHDRGYGSIGCAPCTSPGTGREGRWAGLSKTECGLHLVS